MMLPSELIDAEDRARIDAAVREAEAGTSGEIVVAVVRACAPWPAAAWRCALLMAGIALGAVAIAPIEFSLLHVALAQLSAVAVAFLLVQLPAIRRAFLTDDELTEAAEARAAVLFARQGLAQTAERTGVLLLVALFEHRVVVLADEAVNAALDPGESWEAVVDALLAKIRARQTTEGLLEAIATCGEILSHPLPAPDENEDEIEHTLVLED